MHRRGSTGAHRVDGMTQDELIELLRRHEWRDVEFKEAQRRVPRDAYETVSAFANTEGGHLVFGVRKCDHEMEIVGVLDIDKVQNEFLSTLRQPDKISATIDIVEELHTQDDSNLLIFYVPEVHRSDKPIFLNGDIRRAFVRSGGCDVRCSDQERNRFLIDAAAQRPDGHPVDCDPSTAFDADSVRWYRFVYEGTAGNRSYAELSDTHFLAEMGLLVNQAGESRPTRAAVLMFGTNPAFRQLLPRPVVDCQRFATSRANADTGDRWSDRLVLEENLVRSWRSLIQDWYEKFAEHPFRVDPGTMRRNDTPPDYRAFRESMVNLLIHQDYSDHSRKAAIHHYTDQTVFWNPGDAFAADRDLLEPGEKEVRNPRLVLAFRRIGLSEHAGWGLRDIFRNWQQLGNVPPRITNDKRRKSFELLLNKEALLSERQRTLHQQLGVTLTDEAARVLALAYREPNVTLSQIETATALSRSGAVAVADELARQALIQRVGSDRYSLATHLRKTPATKEQVGDQAVGTRKLATDHVARSLTEHQRRIIDACDVPRSLADLLARAEAKNRAYFRRKHLQPLLEAGIVRMTNPAKPSAPNQRYVLTEDGVALSAARAASAREDCRDSQT